MSLVWVLVLFVYSSTVHARPYFRSATTTPLWQPDTSTMGLEPVTFTWQLPYRNLDWLKDEIEQTSNPSSPRFLRRVYSEAYVDFMVGPSEQDKALVVQWLHSQNNSSSFQIIEQRHTLRITTTALVIEQVFNTSTQWYRHNDTGRRTLVTSTPVHIPDTLVVAAISGLYTFPSRVRSKTQCQPNEVQTFQPVLSPQSLAHAYNFTLRNTNATAQSTRAAVVGGFASFNSNNQQYNEAFSVTDLAQFAVGIGFTPSFTATTYGSTTNDDNLASNIQNTGIGPTDEASLDIQALFQASPTSSNGFIAVNADDGLYESLVTLLNMNPAVRPQVVSYSYSFGDSDYEYYASENGPNTEVQLMLLAQAGVTVVVSSGDDGAPGVYNPQCGPISSLDPSMAPSEYASSVLVPIYPASSAYVLSVSETQFLGGITQDIGAYFDSSVQSPPECNNCPDQTNLGFLCQPTLHAETAVSVTNTFAGDGTTTGGGFSLSFSMPAWQQTAVAQYLDNSASVLPSPSQYNAANRAYPDVAAFGGYFSIVVNGQQLVVSGTSVAAPLWAGFIARMNEVFLVQYGTTLGLAAPFLYNMSATQPNTFNDITTGNNVCPRGNSDCIQGTSTCVGFQASVGWDPVTGLGSPNLGNILRFIQQSSPATGIQSIPAPSTSGACTATSWSILAVLSAIIIHSAAP